MPLSICLIMCSVSLGGMHLWYGPKNDLRYRTSFIKAYLASRAFVLVAVFLSLGRTSFFQIVGYGNHPRIASSGFSYKGHLFGN